MHLHLNAFDGLSPFAGRAWRSGGSRRSAPGGPSWPRKRIERQGLRRNASHRLPYRGRADAGGSSIAGRRWAKVRWSKGIRASLATSTNTAASPVNEPRGPDAVVGALCAAERPGLRRRGHLLQQRRLSGHVRPRHDRPRRDARAHGPAGPGAHRIETPVGIVGASLHDDGRRTVENVAELPHADAVRVACAGHGEVAATWPGAATGSSSLRPRLGLVLANVDPLTAAATAIRDALAR